MDNQRATMTATITILKGFHCIHFTAQPMAGSNHNLWFPLSPIVEKHFEEIERILAVNNIAHNVASIETVRIISTICKDVSIKYNKAQGAAE